MTFGQWPVLLAAVPFLLLFFFLKKLERRRRIVAVSTANVRTNALLRFVTRILPKIAWLGIALALVAALSRPVSFVSKEGIEIQGRIKCISLDLSTSMRQTGRSKAGRSSVEVIKEVTMPFIDKRSITDFITVTVYGGKSSGPENGDATILVRPMQNAEFIKKQIKMVNPGMVGPYTSIGEGVFTCLSSMLDQEFENRKVDRFRLRESLEKGDWEYPGTVVGKLGRMRNMIIILFTDGVNNAGINPLTMVKFCRMLGIKVYFSVLESTGPTGVSADEEVTRREALKDAVRATGGFDFATQIAEDVEKHYDEIDKFESAKIRIAADMKVVERWHDWVLVSLVLLVGMVIVEIIFVKLP